MTASKLGFRGKGSNLNGRPSTALPDNFGNRRTFDEVMVPPDNIGNKAEQDLAGNYIHDGVGNSVDDEPSHHKSGILARVAQNTSKNEVRRRKPERQSMPPMDMVPQKRGVKVVPKDSIPPLPRLHKCTPDLVGDEYVRKLNADFAKLLGTKTGLAFSFSMKPMRDTSSDLENAPEELPQVKMLIEQILESNDIKATVDFAQYRTAAHHFVVFFIGPATRTR